MRDTEEFRPAGSRSPLRRATRKDAHAIAELSDYAGHGIPGYLWSQSAREGEPLIEVGIERALREDANFSYRNAVVAEVEGSVAALMIAYPLPEHSDVNLDEVPDLVRPLEELEQKVPGSFYINILATYPEFRGLGLGTKLLEAAPALASEAGCSELSLQVFEQNGDALRLYERHGYREIARLPAVPHPSYPYEGYVVLMTRSVAP